MWKDIPGYEGIYEASTSGEIRTVFGKTTWSSRFNCERVWQQRILKQKVSQPKGRSRSDARVTLYKDGKPKTCLVSRLIAATFLGDHQDLTVNHKDGNPLNNDVSNLEWLTKLENTQHACENGLCDIHKKPVSLRNVETKEVYDFSSLKEASLFLGKSVGYVSDAIIKDRTIAYPYEIVPHEEAVIHNG